MYISKTKVKQNKQCVKALYLETHEPKLKSESPETLKIFSKGRDIEKVAKSCFKGKSVTGFKHAEKLIQTNYFLSKKEPVIYEAAFTSNDIFIQVDILLLNEDGTYDAIEVKSGTSIKDEYFEDVLIQYFTIVNQKNIQIRKYFVWYINKHAKDISDLFVKEDIIEKLKPLESEYNALISSAKATLALDKVPDVKIGAHCTKPYDCPFMKHCWGSRLGDKKSILSLPGIKNKWGLFNQGIEYITNEKFPLEEYRLKYPNVVKSIIGNQLVLDKKSILDKIGKYKYPLYFFDVETIMGAIPVLKNQSPYQQVVVQYSVHKLDKDFKISRTDFLHDSLDSPESPFLNQLISDVGEEGDIVVYNKTFESTRLKELAEKPAHILVKDKVYKIISRLTDLLDVVEKDIYHPEFRGSFSLKSVTTVLLKGYEGYSNSKIKSGGDVSEVYVEFLKESDPKKKDQIRSDLLQYNRLDTINILLIYIYLLHEDFDLSKYLVDILALK